MKKTSNPFEKLLVDLVNSDIQFITVGGLACAFAGHVRTTDDVDILLSPEPENIKKLITFLSTYEEGHGAELSISDFSDDEGAIRVVEKFPIDIFVVMSGNHYNDLEEYIEQFDLSETLLPTLSAEGLIKLKEGSFREKDKMDVLALSALLK